MTTHYKNLRRPFYENFRAIVQIHLPTFPLPYTTDRDDIVKLDGDAFNAAIEYLAAVCSDRPDVARLVTNYRAMTSIDIKFPADIPAPLKQAIIDRATAILNQRPTSDLEEQRKIVTMIAGEYGLKRRDAQN
jgi:hypothetical protein